MTNLESKAADDSLIEGCDWFRNAKELAEAAIAKGRRELDHQVGSLRRLFAGEITVTSPVNLGDEWSWRDCRRKEKSVLERTNLEEKAIDCGFHGQGGNWEWRRQTQTKLQNWILLFVQIRFQSNHAFATVTLKLIFQHKSGVSV